MSIISDEIYFKAFDKWLEENPGKTINDVNGHEKIIIDGKEIGIGLKLSRIRTGERFSSDDSMKKIKEKYKFIIGNKNILKNVKYEQNLLLALDKWLKENSKKTINDITINQIVVINDEKIPLGDMIARIRYGKKSISEELKKLLEEKYKFSNSLKKVMRKDEIYFKAFDKWLKDNPGKNLNYILHDDVVEIDGEIIPIGNKLLHIRDGVALFSPENMLLLENKYGFVLSKRTLVNKKVILSDVKRRIPIIEAVDKWIDENPGKDINEIPLEETIEMYGKLLNLGERIQQIRNKIGNYPTETVKILTEHYGVRLIDKNLENQKESEKNIKEAIDKWLKENPGKTINDIVAKEIIEVNGKKIRIGLKISEIRNSKAYISNEFLKILINQYKLSAGNKSNTKREGSYEKILEAIDKWLEENKGKTINDITVNDVVFIDKKEYFIGKKILAFKSSYKTSKSIDDQKKFVELLVEKYGFSLEYKKEKGKTYTGDEWLKIIDEWLKLNPGKTINEIPNRDVIVINDDKIKIGSKIAKMRAGENLLDSKTMEILKEKYGFESNSKVYIPKQEEYLEAIEEWLKQNPSKTINDMPYNQIIEINGRKISIGVKLSRMRTGKKLLSEENMKILKEKYGFNISKELDNETGFIREIEPLKKGTNKEIVKEKPYEKYLEEFDGNIEKAKEKYNRIKEIEKKIRENKRNKKKEEISLDEVLKHFNVDIEELNKYLNQISERENISSPIMYEDGETLRNYCIRNGFNYSVIYNLYNTSSNRSLNELIDYYRKNGQNLSTRKVYTKDEVLTKHMLLHLGLDSEIIIRDIEKYDYTLTEAIRNDVFRKNIIKKEDKWLEQLYDDLTDSVDSNKTEEEIHNDLILVMSNALVELKGLLKSDEYQKVLNVFTKYIKTLRNYCKLEVGIEKDRIRRKELIKKYNLDEEDITEGTLMGLDFELGIKRTDKSVESKRLEILKPLIIDWNKFDDKQKEKMIKGYNLSQEEIDKIIEYNNKLVFNLRID